MGTRIEHVGVSSGSGSGDSDLSVGLSVSQQGLSMCTTQPFTFRSSASPSRTPRQQFTGGFSSDIDDDDNLQDMMSGRPLNDPGLASFIGTAQIYLNAQPRPSSSMANLEHGSSPMPIRSTPENNDDLLKPTRDKPVFDGRDMRQTSALGSPGRPCSFVSRTSPLRASHDATQTSSYGDTDSGISTRLRQSFNSHSPHPAHNFDGLSSRTLDHWSSRSHTRSSLSGSRDSLGSPSAGARPPSPAPVCGERRLSDLQLALDESEHRRFLLTDRLKDAQGVIELQSNRLKIAEDAVTAKSFTLDDVRYREKELEKQMNNVEKERDNQKQSRLEEFKTRERLRKKVEALENETKMLRMENGQLHSEANNKRDVMESATVTLTLLERENSKLAKTKDILSKELTALKESLDIARTRNTWLESHDKDNKDGIEKLKQENQLLNKENTTTSTKLLESKRTTKRLREETDVLNATMECVKEEKGRVDVEVLRLRTALTDLKASFATTASDKERYFQEKLDLHQRIQNLAHENECLYKSKLSVEEQMGELQTEVAEALVDTDRMKTARLALEEEFAAVKKVGGVLSTELGNTRAKLEKSLDHVASLEHTNKLAIQQQSLYQQEIHCLEKQIEALNRSIEGLKKEHTKEKDDLDNHHVKVKEEVRHLKSERNHLEEKVHELEAKVKQTDVHLREQGELQRKELDTWRKNTENVTSSMGRKDMAIEALQSRVKELEDELTRQKIEQDSHRNEYEELLESRSELVRLREDHRRLLQERGENQQVIQLLEMQKTILSKTSEGSLTNVCDTELLQSKNDQLAAETHLLRDKLKEMERVRDTLICEKEQRLMYWAAIQRRMDDDLFDGRGSRGQGCTGTEAHSEASGYDREQFEQLQQENDHLKSLNIKSTEKLTRLEEEIAPLKNQKENTVSKEEHQRLETVNSSLAQDVMRLKMQYEQLEQRHHHVITDRHISDREELTTLRKEKENAETTVALVRSDLVLVESSKSKAEARLATMERQLEEATARAATRSRDKEQQATLELQCYQLQGDLEAGRNVQVKQEALIRSLKEELEDEKTKKPSKIRQSLDDVGYELTHMRTQLQKLMEVIQVKDETIVDLEQQLMVTKLEVKNREKTTERSNSVQTNGHLGSSRKVDHGTSTMTDDKLTGLEQERHALKLRINDLERERNELLAEVAKLTKERDLALQDSADLRDGMDDLQQMYDEDRAKLEEKLRKEIRAKERQIECLEEQLRGTTSNELKKLKRDAGRIELLRTENRILQNQLGRNKTRSPLISSADVSPFKPPLIHATEEHTEPSKGVLHSVTDIWDETGEALPKESPKLSLPDLSGADKNTLTSLTTEKDVNEAVALLGGIGLTDHGITLKSKNDSNLEESELAHSDTHKIGHRETSPDAEEAATAKYPHGDALTLSDLESELEGADGRIMPPNLTTRALRLADIGNHYTNRASSEYSSSVFSLTSSESESDEERDDTLVYL